MMSSEQNGEHNTRYEMAMTPSEYHDGAIFLCIKGNNNIIVTLYKLSSTT